jgi:prepilin-type N-terminal cleavage/methylation domain-containing protein
MRARQRERGVSLLEVLAAMALFAIVASGTVALATQSIRRTLDNRQSTAAVLLAAQEVENLRTLDYPAVASESYTQTVAGQLFNVNTVVASDTPVANVKMITVTVSWTSIAGPRSYAVQTIYTDVTAS